MKHWIRLQVSRHCGGCCQSIAKGAPALVITHDVLGIKRIRCTVCAKSVHGSEPPEVIEAQDAPPVPTLQPFSQHRADVKQRQTGERE